MSVSIIAAVAENNVIGKDNKIPWHIPEDFKRFKEITMGHPVIMGRKTFESIMESLGKPLPDRTNIVITRQKDYKIPEGVKIYNSLDDALKIYKNDNVFVIGGAEIYAQAIGKADALYITHIEKVVEGDAKFPDFSETEWKLQSQEKHDGYNFSVYKKLR